MIPVVGDEIAMPAQRSTQFETHTGVPGGERKSCRRGAMERSLAMRSTATS